MKSLLLSITIPTFNRVHLLKQTLEVLLPQVTDEVEVLVCDNCSSDGTWDYLQTLGPKVRAYRHATNIGAERNLLSCLAQAKGQYVWTLCDDDFPCSNTVELVLRAQNEFRSPGLIYLRKQGSDKNLSNYSADPVQSGWSIKDKNELLVDVGVWITFCSSIVVRRCCLDLGFLYSRTGNFLVPTAIALQAAGTTNHVIISEKPLLYVRVGSAGAYDALTIFSKNLKRLLELCQCYGYDREVLDATFRDSLAGPVLNYLVWWPLSWRGLYNVICYSATYPIFYTTLLPALLKRGHHRIRRMLELATARP